MSVCFREDREGWWRHLRFILSSGFDRDEYAQQSGKEEATNREAIEQSISDSSTKTE